MLLLELFNMLLEGKLENYAEANADKLRAVLLQQNANTSVGQILNQITQIDPSNNKSLSVWLLKLFINKDFTISEFPKVSSVLQQYQMIKSRLENFDPTILSSIDQLEQKINNIPKSNTQTQKEYVKSLYDSGQIKIIQTLPRGKVYEVHSVEAMKLIGKNTKWCTAADEENQFHDYYTPTNPIYVFIDKIANKKYSFDQRNGEIMDELDENLNESEDEKDIELYLYMMENINVIKNNFWDYNHNYEDMIYHDSLLSDWNFVSRRITRLISLLRFIDYCAYHHKYAFVMAISTGEHNNEIDKYIPDYDKIHINDFVDLFAFLTKQPIDLPPNLQQDYNITKKALLKYFTKQ